MKKINKLIIILSLFLIPLFVSAKGVDEVNFNVEEVYVNSTVDIVGSMHIQEAIVINGSLNGFERIINYKNPNLKEWNGGKVNFENSSIYNARGVSLSKVSSVKIDKEDIDWKLLDNFSNLYEEVESANKGDTNVYTLETTNSGINVRVYNPNESGYIVYLFDYYIDQAVILHNDVAELYWTFIPLDFDDVNNAHIQVTIPGTCTDETFRFWAHGPISGEISGISEAKDDNGKYLYKGVIADVSDIKEGMGTDIRMTFDKSIMSYGESILTNSNQDALEEIIKVETKRADSANSQRRISKIVYYGIIILSCGYFIGLVILWIYMYFKYDREYKSNFDQKYNREFTGEYDVEVVDYLMNKSVSTNAMSASIMNLIYKKNIEIIENPNDKKNPTLRLKSRDNVSSSEAKIIELLFDKIANKKDGTLEVTTKEIEKYSKKTSTAEKFMNGYNAWKDEVETVALNENFFEDHSNKKIAAGLYLVLGFVIIGLMFLFDMFFPILMLLIILSSVAFVFYISTFKKWTPKGREHYLKWNAFKNFLKDFGSFETKDLPEIKLWEKYLIYATLFGIAKEVGKTMKVKLSEMNDIDSSYFPSSYVFYNNYYIGNTISDSINKSHANSVSTINAEAARSSMSSGSGFGGGFSSGGGFGGGGGGGHGF